MSSARFATPFSVTLHGSLQLAAILSLMHGGALVWLFLFVLPGWLTLMATAVVGVSLFLQLRRHLFMQGSRVVTALRWDGGDLWQLQRSQGEGVDATLLGSSFVTPWLIVLNFKIESGRLMLPVVVMPDSVDEASFRRLTSKLRRVAGAGPAV